MRSSPPRLVSALLLGLSLALCPGLAWSSPRPTFTDIAIDGDMSDWSLVLQNPANTTLDGEGSVPDCADTLDRDCPVTDPALDLRRFAWTSNASSLFLYFERQASSDDWSRFFVFLDENRDTLAQTGEPVVELVLQDAAGTRSELSVQQYIAGGAGDPLADVGGLVDGYGLLETALAPGVALASDIGTQPGGRVHEARIPWAALAVAPNTPFGFHVASSSDLLLPALADNLGGAEGGLGSTAWREVQVDGPFEIGVDVGSFAWIRHAVTNSGSLPGRLDVALASSCAVDTELWLDSDLDGTEDIYLGRDAAGDGSFAGPGDELRPEGDSDGDGRLDLGILAGGQSVGLSLRQGAADPATCPTERLELRLAHQGESTTAVSVADLVHVGPFSLVPDSLRRVGTGGDSAWLAHVAVNNTGGSATVDLSCDNALGWACAVFDDPDGDGDPSDATPLLPLLVGPGTGRDVLIRVDVPPAVLPGLVNPVVVRLIADDIVRTVAIDTITVVNPVVLSPNHVRDIGLERHGSSGGSVYFPHRVQNGRSVDDTVVLSGSSDAGWPVAFLSDPDRDGRPFDAQPLSPAVIDVPAGGSADFFLRVDLPLDASPPAQSRIAVTATSGLDPLASATVHDDAQAAIVTLHEDRDGLVSLVETLPCSPVHARASGVSATSRHRFAWREPSGVAFALDEFTSDAMGSGVDSITLGPTLGDGFAVDLDADSPPDWLLQDTAAFDVPEPLSIDGLETASPSHGFESPLVVTATIVNASFVLAPQDYTMSWLVLSPDGTTYLDAASGEFLPYTGLETTHEEIVATIERASSYAAVLTVPSVRFVQGGPHVTELWSLAPCGSRSLLGTLEFEVIDDGDGDGLTLAEELAAGTDPGDADSDDDGLLDGADGLADTDADGSLDALDCDSDDDGLFDGLEFAVVVPHQDTDLGSGCFQPDADLGSSTDPDAADSDAGGIADGIEDANRNGRVDAGESDPRDPADDTATCDPAVPPELTGLQLMREAGAVRLSWDVLDADPCRSYAVLASDALPDFFELSTSLDEALHLDTGAQGLRYYLVRADSSLAGLGPVGR